MIITRGAGGSVDRPYLTDNEQDDTDASPSTREPEHFPFSRGLSRVQERRDAMVDGQRLQCPDLARPEIVLRENSVSGPAHRHDLRISRDARVPRLGDVALQIEPGREDQRRGAEARDRLRNA